MTASKADSGASSPSRRPIHISPNLDRSLLGYAAATSAAGVALLSLVQPAEAKIIYRPTNIPIPENGGLIQLDINQDGVPDFGFSAASYFGSARGARAPLGLYHKSLLVLPDRTANQIEGIVSGQSADCAAELPGKFAVGHGRDFQPGRNLMFEVGGDATTQFSARCPWRENNGGYVGLKLVVSGETHYGWARVSLRGISATLRGYAYETIPNKPILTGATSGRDEDASASMPPARSSPAAQPARLGLLAGGTTRLAAWRRPQEEMN